MNFNIENTNRNKKHKSEIMCKNIKNIVFRIHEIKIFFIMKNYEASLTSITKYKQERAALQELKEAILLQENPRFR